MNKNYIATPVALFALAGSAQAVTIATFKDPSPSGATPLFSASDTEVSAEWLGTGMTLKIPYAAVEFTDVKMEMLAVTRSGSDLGAGMVTFWTDASTKAAPIFTMTFDGGSIFEPFAQGSNELVGDVIDFGGSAIAGLDPLENEQFAFSFANPEDHGTHRTYTSAMTSSADAVPEPATMTLLGAGLAAYAARRRRKA